MPRKPLPSLLTFLNKKVPLITSAFLEFRENDQPSFNVHTEVLGVSTSDFYMASDCYKRRSTTLEVLDEHFDSLLSQLISLYLSAIENQDDPPEETADVPKAP